MAAIDRDYWLDFARENVSKSIQSREDAATKLDDFLSWLWTIYTSIFALGSLLGYISNNVQQLVAVSLPVLVIMLARLFCKMVSMPSITGAATADPNVVPEIIEGFVLIVADKKRKLRIAVTWTIFSILSICIALTGYNLFDGNRELKREIETAKLKKDLSTQAITVTRPQQQQNDSVKLMNDYYDYCIQNELKKRKFDCIQTGSQECADKVNAMSK